MIYGAAIAIFKLDHNARTCGNIWSISKKITNFKFNIFKITYLKKIGE